MDIHDFIKKRKHLVWYTKNFDGLSEDAIVEAALNYGDWNDVQELIKILGMKRTAEIFEERSNWPRSNYDPEVKKFFHSFFKKYRTKNTSNFSISEDEKQNGKPMFSLSNVIGRNRVHTQGFRPPKK